MPGPDEIHVASLELRVHIGVTERERAEPQRLTVSLTMRLRDGFRALDDRIEGTINYSAVCAVVRELAAHGEPRHLLETLAEDIAAAILTGFPACAEVDVELRKYVLPDTDYVAVRLTRRQSSPPAL